MLEYELSQELVNGAIDQWSKRLLLVIRSHGGLDTLSIVSLNSVKLVCCKLFFLSRLCLEEVVGIDVFE